MKSSKYSAGKKGGATYASAGVDIGRGEQVVDFLRKINPAIGGFAGLVPLGAAMKGMRHPMLVASTDGVGTKLLVAKEAGDLSTIGIDLVAMVVNDLLVCGARPLFFLDYYATGRLELKDAKEVIRGIVKGCKIAKCPLIGGETAELPGLYREGDFDLAGFGVGIVDELRVIDGRGIKSGDVVLGFPSTGLHSNGYSLARKVLLGSGRNVARKLGEKPAGLRSTVSQALLKPTQIYTDLVDAMLTSKMHIKAFAHITGGGIVGNLNRVLPKSVNARICTTTWKVPEIFRLIQERGAVADTEMFQTFNMGIGFTAVASSGDASVITEIARMAGYAALWIGRIEAGAGQVVIDQRTLADVMRDARPHKPRPGYR